MKNYESSHIKNIVLLGHPGSGKTSLAEAMLFEASVINRIGAVDAKNTVSDYNELEQERGNSIYSTLMHLEWKDSKINIIDTPGFDDYISEVMAALKVSDTALMVLNAQQGVEVQTEILWDCVKQQNKPLFFTINQIDQEKADVDASFEQLKKHFGNKVTLIQYPLNPGHDCNSIIDVLRMIMYKFPKGGGKPEKLPIPDSEKAKAEKLHTVLVENIAGTDETLMELYFEKGALQEDEMRKGLKKALLEREIFPVFCTSAKQNMGSGRIMGFINNVAPSPIEMPQEVLQDGKKLVCDAKGDTCLFIYKTISEPNLGDMSFLKVYSGEIKVGMDLINENTNNTERFNQLYLVNGKNRINVTTLTAGDIGATVKLKKTHSNNTLHSKGKNIEITPILYPIPTIRIAVDPLKKGEEEKLSQALHQIHEEDPSIIIEHSQELKQIILHIIGELQLNLIKWRLQNTFKLSVDFIKPRIPYRETIRKSARSNYRHKKQSGGSGQFGEVHMLVEPYSEGMPNPAGLSVRGKETIDLKWGGKLEFLNCIVGGAIDAKFMPSILKGILEKMEDGPIIGSCVRDVRVSIYDGKMHPVDSNDISFKLAGLMAFKEAFQNSDPIILEPLYEIEVSTPDELGGDVMSDLQGRRSIILGMDSQNNKQIIKAKVPLAEIHNYASSLRAITQGRAKHKQKYVEYAAIPFEVQKQLVDEYKAELQEA